MQNARMQMSEGRLHIIARLCEWCSFVRPMLVMNLYINDSLNEQFSLWKRKTHLYINARLDELFSSEPMLVRMLCSFVWMMLVWTSYAHLYIDARSDELCSFVYARLDEICSLWKSKFRFAEGPTKMLYKYHKSYKIPFNLIVHL